MPFAATWIGLEIFIPSEVSQTKTNIIYITYMWNLKYDTNEFIYKIESQTANKFMVTKGERGEKLGVWN